MRQLKGFAKYELNNPTILYDGFPTEPMTVNTVPLMSERSRAIESVWEPKVKDSTVNDYYYEFYCVHNTVRLTDKIFYTVIVGPSVLSLVF